jgi:hypothetical protein
MAKSKITRLHAARPANTLAAADLVARIGFPLEVVRLLLAERHEQGQGLDASELSSVHHVISECSSLLWSGGA